ncbi:DUF3471 domain-containing protein, partial [Steroidobacter sp.]|uniref:DUF3471 domain-containing protein n=1 Tax=Steroidobacter sp. TaxID=1978227 RepID=UPI001A54718F
VSNDGRKALRMLLQDGQLQLSSRGYESPLRPVAQQRFYGADDRDLIVFSRSTRNPGAVELQRSSEPDMPYRRVPTWSPAPQDLSVYAGTYRSEEIEIPYRISVQQGNLVVTTLKWNTGVPLIPMAQDLFTSKECGYVRFTRDSGGRVTGMTFNGYVVDLRFSRSD